MANSNLVQLIQQIAVNAINTGKPCDYIVGIVVSDNPLKIKVSQSLTLEAEFLHLARDVTDFETEISVLNNYEWKTEEKSGGGGYAEFAPHKHEIILARKKIKIHNALKTGEKVLLIRKSGGQDYIVIDRVVN